MRHVLVLLPELVRDLMLGQPRKPAQVEPIRRSHGDHHVMALAPVLADFRAPTRTNRRRHHEKPRRCLHPVRPESLHEETIDVSRVVPGVICEFEIRI